ncbi:MAG: PIG-L family deacetylase [Candidatus Hydrogenedentes bacterium]|nr:PIG-L family deacetylase [Candidatus Hydrogenedentota bacterium]
MNTLSRREALHIGATAAALALPLGAAAIEDGGKKAKVLVAGGHPDDPESGCGGLIALYTASGHEVVNLYLTRGEAGIPGKTHAEAAAIRTAEAEAACRVLGARARFAGQVDGATEVNAAQYDVVREIMGEESPDIVYTHWPIDTHRDHRAMSYLIYDAWLKKGREFELFYFEVESGVQTQHFSPAHYIDISTVEAKKREACYLHESQRPDGFYGLHSEMHAFRGREGGCRLAEGFIRHKLNRSALS